MAGLSEAVRLAMLAKRQQVMDRQQSGTFTPSWNLTGKNAVVSQGDDVIVRFGPRWDIALFDEKGKFVKWNPEYVSGAEPIFVSVYEHWWDADGGKIGHAWCPRTLNIDAECPVCLASQFLLKSANEDDRKEGKRIAAKEVFIFNAVVGVPRKLADKVADFRILAVPGTIYTAVTDIMTGGSDSSFARGNIGDPVEGYDLKLTRPRAGGNDRWKVDCSPTPTRLFDDKQAAAFKGWPEMLTDLDKMIESEMKTPLDLFKQYYGRDPEGDEVTPALASTTPEVAPEVAPEETNTGPDLANEFLPPSTAGRTATAKTAPTPLVKTTPAAFARPRTTGGRR